MTINPRAYTYMTSMHARVPLHMKTNNKLSNTSLAALKVFKKQPEEVKGKESIPSSPTLTQENLLSALESFENIHEFPKQKPLKLKLRKYFVDFPESLVWSFAACYKQGLANAMDFIIYEIVVKPTHFFAHVCPEIKKNTFNLFKENAATDLIAQVFLGICYEWGIGTVNNMDAAFELYKSAAKSNDSWGLALFASISNNDLRSSMHLKYVDLLEKSSVKGNLFAKAILGDHYLYEYKKKKTDGSALIRGYSLLQMPLSHECTNAIHTLGMCHFYGIGIEKNKKEAIKCFEKAAQYRYEPAESMLLHIKPKWKVTNLELR